MGQNLTATAKERIEAIKRTPSSEINLSGCELRVFPKALFKLHFTLKRLNLSKNFIKVIPPEIIKMEDLESLDISFNDIFGVSVEIQNMAKLTSLSVEGNTELSYLPDLPKLLSLNISGTNIGPLPPHMKLKALTELSVSGMRLEVIPPAILELHNLRSLKISNNKIRQISPDIAKLTNLERLDLVSNPLVDLPPSIGELSHLTHLLVSQTELRDLPAEVGRLERLVVLDIRLTFIDVLNITFERMANLKELLASGGRLREIGPISRHTMLGLKSIEIIDLSGNRLESIPKEMGYLATLRKLELQQNQIQVLPGEIGFFNPAIEMNLTGNPLKHPFSTLIQDGGIVALLEGVANFCSSHADHCVMDNKIDNVQSHTPISFRIIAKDFKGRQRLTGREPFVLKIIRKDGPNAGNVMESFLRDNHEKKDPGTYDCYFNLPEPGTYEVSVLLEDRHISGSPFIVQAS